MYLFIFQYIGCTILKHGGGEITKKQNLMECKNIKVTVIYYYTKYIKVINHGKITYPPNIFYHFSLSSSTIL